MLNIHKELRDFVRFFWKTPNEEKLLVFYSEHEGYYSYFEGIIDNLVNEHKQVLCYVTSDPKDPILQSSESLIKTFYINKLLSTFMTIVNCKIFVMTLTDLNQFHLKRSQYPVHYLYVFHSLVSTHMMYRQGAFDYYDSILCAGPHHFKEIKKNEELNRIERKQLILAGYYRLERIYHSYQQSLLENNTAKLTRTILIAPSWGKDNVLELYGKHLVEILLQEGFRVIVRPHPETLRSNPKLINFLVTKYGTNSNFKLEKSVSTDDSIIYADVLICDLSGIALEYAFGTERPILFLDGPIKVKNEHYMKLDILPLELSIRSEIGKIVSTENIKSVPLIIDELILNREKFRSKINELRDQYVSAFGNSSEVGARHILNLL